MAFEQGSVSVFANKDIADENLDQGTGAQTVFNMQCALPPIFLTPFTLKYIVSSTPFTATSDSAGVLTGTHISTGQVNEDGTVDVTFSTAPDNLTDIDADNRAKGLLQKIKEFVTTNQWQELSVDQGDGAQTVFSGNLLNGTTLAKGQVRVTFTINSFVYNVYDNGLGEWIHDEIASSSFDYGTQAWAITFANPPDNLTDIDFFYGEGAEGQDWLVLQDEDTQDNDLVTPADAFPGELLQQIVLKNSGKSFEETVIIGLRECLSVANTFYSINFNGYKTFADGDPWNISSSGVTGHAQTSYDATRESFNTLPRVSLRDDAMEYWLFSSKNRIMFAVRVIGTIYESAYLGHFLRFSAPQKYNQALIITGSHQGTPNFNDTGLNHRFIVDANTGGNLLMIDPENEWQRGRATPDFPKVMPYFDKVLTAGAYTETTDSKTPIWPIYIASDIRDWVYGQIEGLWHVPGDHLTTEDTVTISARTIYIFQNVFRTAYHEFLGMEDI